MTEKYDVSNTPFGPSMSLDEMVQSTTGTVGSKSSSISGGNKPRNWASQQIAIKPIPPATCTISANPTSVAQGDSSTLIWTSQNATAASLSSVGTVAINGSTNVIPNADMTYTLTVSGVGGSGTCTTSVSVIPPGSPSI